MEAAMNYCSIFIVTAFLACSPAGISRNSFVNDYRVAMAPFVNISGNIIGDARGNPAATSLEGGIAAELKARHCFKKIVSCQIGIPPEYPFDSLNVNDDYFVALRSALNLKELKCDFNVVLILYDVSMDTMMLIEGPEGMTGPKNGFVFRGNYVYWNTDLKRAVAHGIIDRRIPVSAQSSVSYDWGALSNTIADGLLVDVR
jgi:hypothetical protein